MSNSPELRDANDEIAPDRFLIAHDDYHARYVGKTEDGRQFFITTPFVWGAGTASGSEYAVRYLFDEEGALLDAIILPLGVRPGSGALPGNTAVFPEQEAAVTTLIAEISPVSYKDITIAPFRITHDGIDFGMVLNGPEDDDDDEWYWNVTIEPGDYMAFSSPWDSGDYDT